MNTFTRPSRDRERDRDRGVGGGVGGGGGGGNVHDVMFGMTVTGTTAHNMSASDVTGADPMSFSDSPFQHYHQHFNPIGYHHAGKVTDDGPPRGPPPTTTWNPGTGATHVVGARGHHGHGHGHDVDGDDVDGDEMEGIENY
eukprot:GFYU01026874.1.p1 GENE.GFYU01026874.1~~GFYU01026874.1.p1  ORF type:complete len:141 (-),score=41.77 GFYU01026874.1:85-507(-)